MKTGYQINLIIVSIGQIYLPEWQLHIQRSNIVLKKGGGYAIIQQ